MQLLGSRGRVALAMFAVGILAFIFVDVLSNGLGIVDNQLDLVKHHHGSVAYLIWLVVLLGAGFVAGSAGLAMLEQRIRPVGARTPPIAGGAGPAALPADEAGWLEHELEFARTRALRRGLTIAPALRGAHLGDGPASGVSA